MKKLLKILLAVLVIALIGGWLYWQQHKKSIIKNQISQAISKGTNSLYFIQYDSSAIDEIAGNASFYNIKLQSDSLEQQLKKFDSSSPNSVYNVFIQQVNITGANIAALLNNSKVEATSIEIINPVIYIINNGRKKKDAPVTYDTLSLYEKILGKYSSIKSSQIVISNARLLFTDPTGTPNTTLNGISINLKNFSIDSSKDYSNIISYFIKDIVATVKEVQVNKGVNFLHFSNIEYNAPKKFIHLDHFIEKDTAGNILFDINNTSINAISTDSFILRQQLHAGEIKTDGGNIKLFRRAQTTPNQEAELIDFENDSFDELFLNSITVGKTNIKIFDRKDTAKPVFELNNVLFSAKNIGQLYSGFNIRDLIGRTDWNISADGFSFLAKDKVYKFEVGNFEINSGNSTAQVSRFAVVPQLSQDAFMKRQRYQKDYYNLVFNNIKLEAVNIHSLVTDKKLLAGVLTLQPVINIYNDRNVTPNPSSKVGMYPQQQLVKIKFPFLVKKINVVNASVVYKERAAISKKTGTVFFKNVNAVISNVTNLKDAISTNNIMQLDASGEFMGASKIKTTWKLPLNSSNGSFQAAGTANAFNAKILNSIIEPLGMASVKKGNINGLSFDIKGDDYTAKGSEILLYNDLKLELLKKDSNELKKKGLMSFVANALVKNSNPQNDNTRKGTIDFKRDTTKSFFNLLWKSIFDGAKNTVQKL